jgi:hypothetical protein
VKSTSPVVSTSKSSTSGLLALGHSEYQASKPKGRGQASKHITLSRLAMLDTFVR